MPRAAAGVAVAWAGGRFIHPPGFGQSRNQHVLTGGRRVRVTALM
jgi:hypothetical protein